MANMSVIQMSSVIEKYHLNKYFVTYFGTNQSWLFLLAYIVAVDKRSAERRFPKWKISKLIKTPIISCG